MAKTNPATAISRIYPVRLITILKELMEYSYEIYVVNMLDLNGRWRLNLAPEWKGFRCLSYV